MASESELSKSISQSTDKLEIVEFIEKYVDENGK